MHAEQHSEQETPPALPAPETAHPAQELLVELAGLKARTEAAEAMVVVATARAVTAEERAAELAVERDWLRARVEALTPVVQAPRRGVLARLLGFA